MKKIKFRQDEEAKAILVNWRKELARHTGARAELRRARDTISIAQVGFYHVLIRRLRDADYEITRFNRDKIAVAAALVARIKFNSDKIPFASQMARKRKGSKTPLISKMRLQRILAAEQSDEMLRELSSAIRILNETANMVDLADSVINWNDSIRRDWLYIYYGNTTT